MADFEIRTEFVMPAMPPVPDEQMAVLQAWVDAELEKFMQQTFGAPQNAATFGAGYAAAAASDTNRSAVAGGAESGGSGIDAAPIRWGAISITGS
jgi:hypothetical protein